VLRIVELCGMDPVALRAERDALPVPRPVATAKVRETLQLASEDAARLGQPEVRPENLLFGLFRAAGIPFEHLKIVGGMDIERFRADFRDRLSPPGARASHPELPLDPDARATVDAAIGLARERRTEILHPGYLLRALLRSETDPVGQLLAGYGLDVAKVHAELGRM
jgi:hypothetical protein